MSESKISSDSRRSYDSPDSWCEISSGTSSEDLLNGSSPRNELSLPLGKHLSPKVFLPGSSTLNSPASVVLGRHKFPGGHPTTVTKSPFYNSVSVYEDRVDHHFNGGDEKLPNGHFSDRNNNSNPNGSGPNGDDANGKMDEKNGARFSSSSESLSPKQRIVPPSPAFNRNPCYFNAKCSSPTSDYSTFSGSPLFSSSPRFSNGNASVPKVEKNGSLSSPSGSYDSVGSLNENGFRKADSEMKRKQVSVRVSMPHLCQGFSKSDHTVSRKFRKIKLILLGWFVKFISFFTTTMGHAGGYPSLRAQYT